MLRKKKKKGKVPFFVVQPAVALTKDSNRPHTLANTAACGSHCEQLNHTQTGTRYLQHLLLRKDDCSK